MGHHGEPLPRPRDAARGPRGQDGHADQAREPVVSAAGEYLGGIIALGVEISLEALFERAARLPKVDLEEPRALIGKSTVDAVRSGVVYGVAAQVDGIVRRVRAELGEEAEAIATGGLAGHIVPHTETIDEVDDLLTLTGLRLIQQRNGA